MLRQRFPNVLQNALRSNFLRPSSSMYMATRHASYSNKSWSQLVDDVEEANKQLQATMESLKCRASVLDETEDEASPENEDMVKRTVDIWLNDLKNQHERLENVDTVLSKKEKLLNDAAQA
eukprot:CAMPEP_0197056610 /NCGR_PEP_ID=MMETSP1384-20130603/87736_1 /TAXON_ID=29189 /ORGANISM="Ammonia sp." /LENGTH=120 /DNA_ID=CAMNT_0042490685 /DNA_START=84 /DNA_END=446 /DNA_ORIENTATION=+